MKFLVLLASIAAASARSFFHDDLLVLDYETNINPNPLIVGGTEVSIASRPFQLSLRLNGNHICGASIISTVWALSAGHCYASGTNPNPYTFRAGSNSHLSGGVIYNSAQIITASEFDAAVHRIFGSFDGANQTPIQLAARLVTYGPGTNAVVSGWGHTLTGGSLSTNLRAVTIQMVSAAVCNRGDK
jgi:trypsin